MSSSSDRKAKIQAASSKKGGGANAIIVAGIVAVLAMVTIVGGVIWASQKGGGDETASGSGVPKGAEMGQPFVPERQKEAAGDVPTVDVYEDFRCPACAAMEGAFGKTMEDLAEEGKIKLRYNFRLVIDESSNQKNSLKAAAASLCAADEGKWTDYHSKLFAAQPQNHGEYTDENFSSIAEDSGITGDSLKTFTSCLDSQKYGKYVESVNEASAKAGVNSTPTIKVNDEEMNWGAFVKDDNSLDLEGFSTALTTGTLPDAAKK